MQFSLVGPHSKGTETQSCDMHARYHKVGEHVKQVCLAPDMELGRSGWYIK